MAPFCRASARPSRRTTTTKTGAGQSSVGEVRLTFRRSPTTGDWSVSTSPAKRASHAGPAPGIRLRMRRKGLSDDWFIGLPPRFARTMRALRCSRGLPVLTIDCSDRKPIHSTKSFLRGPPHQTGPMKPIPLHMRRFGCPVMFMEDAVLQEMADTVAAIYAEANQNAMPLLAPLFDGTDVFELDEEWSIAQKFELPDDLPESLHEWNEGHPFEHLYWKDYNGCGPMFPPGGTNSGLKLGDLRMQRKGKIGT